MAKKQKLKFSLKGGNWDGLNHTLNQSRSLQSMMDRVASSIADSARTEYSIRGLEGMGDAVRVGNGEANEKIGVRVRFVSHPSLAFEMQYNILREALDDHSE